MSLNHEERRQILAQCCAVARADGQVSTGEYELLLDLLARLGNAASYAELQEWLEHGPPAATIKMTEDHLRLFLREAIAVAHADGKVAQTELDTIKRIASQTIKE